MPRSPRITLFQWGYEGWGNATRTLVRRVDAVERARGFEPPMFVDVRYSRSVRAVGFRDHAFEQQLGHERYRWMRSLGNAAIGTRSNEMRIQCPDAAEQLLDLAMDAAAANRRVIFFCSCPSPEGVEWCHRTQVGKLAARAARRRGVRLTIEEWPGGMPSARSIERVSIGRTELRCVRAGAQSIPLTPGEARAALSGLPWGGLVQLATGGDEQMVAAGPLQFRAQRWQLPIFLHPVLVGDRSSQLIFWGRKLRAKLRLDQRGTKRVR